MDSRLINLAALLCSLTLLIFLLYTLFTYWDRLPPKFNEKITYQVVEDDDTCTLRLRDTSTNRETVIAGTSNSDVRKYIDQNVQIKGKYIYSDKLPKNTSPLMNASNECKIKGDNVYMLTVLVESIVPIKK